LADGLTCDTNGFELENRVHDKQLQQKDMTIQLFRAIQLSFFIFLSLHV